MIFQLEQNIGFPPVELSEPDGLLAVGGDLSVPRLIAAYSMGIFPWFNPQDPILWWSPDPRPIFIPGQMKVSKTLRQTIKRQSYSVTFDKAFESVLLYCSEVPRSGQNGTWLTQEMKEAYTNLHHQGLCHSVEVWQNEQLVGGLYGVAIGRAFIGESMFHKADNASKVAFYFLSELLKKLEFHFIDGQVSTPHLLSLGAKEIARQEYISLLIEAIRFPSIDFSWTEMKIN